MFKILRARADAYITNQVVDGERVESANTGLASSINLYKLYGMTFSGSTPNVELSRAFINFDLDPIRTLVSEGKIDTNHSSFTCRLKMFDVDGGQTCPANFVMTVNPLSRSFDEGLGRDIVLYADDDVCNFLTGSRMQGAWVQSGSSAGGHNSAIVDYLTSATLNGVSASLESTQTFALGTEDLNVDVTRIVSASVANVIPDRGFRLAFSPSIETDERTYFVKRFASRHAYNDDYHPRLEFTYDDSLQDDSAGLFVGSTSTLFLRNFNGGQYSNLLSASTAVTGQNSLILRLETQVSGGVLSFPFTGSQHRSGLNLATGIYSASVIIPESAAVNAKLQRSGSISFTPIWGSLDGTVGYLTGAVITAYKPQRGSSQVNDTMFVTVTNVKSEYVSTETSYMRMNVFDPLSQNLLVSKVPVEFVGLIVRDMHYQIRCVETDKVLVPFDTTYNSTRVSSDASGMFFQVDISSLNVNRTYVVDALMVRNGERRLFKSVSGIFKVLQQTV